MVLGGLILLVVLAGTVYLTRLIGFRKTVHLARVIVTAGEKDRKVINTLWSGTGDTNLAGVVTEIKNDRIKVWNFRGEKYYPYYNQMIIDSYDVCQPGSENNTSVSARDVSKAEFVQNGLKSYVHLGFAQKGVNKYVVKIRLFSGLPFVSDYKTRCG